jgi:hypothetical protein
MSHLLVYPSGCLGLILALATLSCGADDQSGRKDKPKDSGTDTASAKDASNDVKVDVTSVPDAESDSASDAGAGCPRLVKYGLDIPTPSFVAAHVAEVDAKPFDGLVMTLPASSSIQRAEPVNQSELDDSLAPIASLSFANVRHNFVRVLATYAGSFDDYATPAANFRALAAAAKSAGLEGIFFDNEVYFPELGSVWGPSACTTPDTPTCQSKARAAGKLVMSEMIAEWPNVTVIVPYGPWVSDAMTYDWFSGHFPYNDVAFANPYMGPFVVGMIEATVGSAATLVDGGEIYAIRALDDFEYAKNWMKWELPKQSTLIPSSLADSYGSTVSVGFGVYDREFRGAAMSSSLWQTTLTNALAVSDRYVWAYTEEHDWWGVGWPQGGPPPQAWIDATIAARASMGCTERRR